MFWFIVWLVCTFIATAITINKGRGGAVGFFSGFLLGPIGILIALLLSPDHVALEKQQVTTGTSKKCPYCAEVIKADAIVCRYCGRDIAPVAAQAAAMGAGQPAPAHKGYARMLFAGSGRYECSVCDAEVDVGETKCPGCGSTFSKNHLVS